MMTRNQVGGALGAVFAACALAAPLVVQHEGWELRSYPDPAVGNRLPTACAGVTEGVVAGKTYTPDQCIEMTAAAMVKHGAAIDRCITVEIPVESRAAFTSFAYNVGVGAFCSSTMARKLNAGDLRGACAELSRWTWAGGRQLPGLVKRRAAERAYCERGLA